MSVVLFFTVLLILSIITIIVIYRKYLQSSKDKDLLDKKIHDLETTFVATKAELDKNIKAIVELKKNNQYEIYAGQIVSQMNQGVIFIDQNHIIKLINPYAEKFIENPPAIGKMYQQALHFQVNEKWDYSLFESAFTGKVQVLPDNSEIITPLGKISVSGTIIPLASNDTIKTIVFIFTDSSQRVSQAQEEKALFSATTHELRTPLTAIRMTISLLLQQFDSLGREKIIEYLTKTNVAVDHLTNLINDFLNLSRIDQGRVAVDKKPFNLITVTDEVIQELSLLIKERKLYIHHEPIEGEYKNVIGDPTRSKEILINLLSNSIKYTIQGGITISHQVENTFLVTKVIDTGNGIPEESRSLLFKRFFQIGGARLQSSSKGSGLGLYISKKLAQLMGGDVSLESSEPGQGSTFVFKLPLTQK